MSYLASDERNFSIPPELARLSTFLDSNIECLAGSSGELRSIALCAAKHIFDWALETEKSSKPHLSTLLATLTQATPPQTRSQARSKSIQRRSPSPVQRSRRKVDVQETPLPSLFTEGMNIDQIWQQLDLRASRVCENLEILQGENESPNANSDSENEEEDEDEDEDEDDSAEMDIDEDEDLWGELSSGEEDGSSTGEGVINLEEEISEDDEDRESPSSMLDVIRDQQKPSSYSFGLSGLDDGFFDLATFNAEIKEVSKRKLDLVAEEASTEESEIDLFGSINDSETEGAPTELFYGDFFESPGRTQKQKIKSSKVRFNGRVSVKKIKAVGRGMPVSSMGEEDSDEDEDYEEDSD